MSGEQPPNNGLAALGWVGFGQFDQAQCDLPWQLRRADLARSGDRDDPEAQLQPSLALGPTRALAQDHPTGAGQWRLAGNRDQGAAADQASIVMNSAQHMDTRLRHQRPQGVKIGLAVGHDRHRLGILKHTLAGIGGFDPAARFFLIKRPFAVRYADPAGAGPDLASNPSPGKPWFGRPLPPWHAAARHAPRLCQSHPDRGCALWSCEN
jgi:hypothetical protein